MEACSRLFSSMLVSTFLLLTCISFISCSDKKPLEDSVSLAQVSPITASTKENDKRFLARAVEMKYEQILLGKLVQRRSVSEEVKGLAKMLEEANREAKSSLASLSIIKSISVPSAPPQIALDAYDQLNASSVEEFDFAYIDQVIQLHNDAISLFENATHGNLDPEIKSIASAMLPDIRNHLSKAIELNAHMNPISMATP